MNICDYGCGKEANYQFKNGKWCCKKHYKQCPYQKQIMEGENNYFYGKSHTTAFKEEHAIRMKKIMEDPNKNPMKRLDVRKKCRGRKLTEEHKNKIRISQLRENNSMFGRTRTIEYMKRKYPFFSKIEEMRYNPNKPGEKEIQVHCKYNECENSKEKDGWFTPTGRQIECRVRMLENKEGNEGSYFYCSDGCKNLCPLYGSKGIDPFKEILELPYTQEEYNLWKQTVLEQDNYQCQMCGSKENLHCHHIVPIKENEMLVLDPDNGIVLCQKCHYEIGHKTGTECSTGNLANKTCKRRK